MKLLRAAAIAISRYSKIPMPYFSADEDDMRYNLIFLPMIGAIIGGISYVAYWLMVYADVPAFVMACVMAVIPLLVTGGFHMDGFLDVSDALSSYADVGKKLEILKDPHIGAFAVIRAMQYSAVYMAALYMIVYAGNIFVVCFSVSFLVARAAGGICSICFKNAKEDGMLSEETLGANRVVLIALVGELVLGVVLIGVLNLTGGVISVLVITVFTFIFRNVIYKNFGGMTGDTAGFYICSLELAIMCTLAAEYLICSMINA